MVIRHPCLIRSLFEIQNVKLRHQIQQSEEEKDEKEQGMKQGKEKGERNITSGWEMRMVIIKRIRRTGGKRRSKEEKMREGDEGGEVTVV